MCTLLRSAQDPFCMELLAMKRFASQPRSLSLVVLHGRFATKDQMGHNERAKK